MIIIYLYIYIHIMYIFVYIYYVFICIYIYIYILCIYIYILCMYVCIYIMYMYIRIYVYESKLWEVLPFGIFRQVQPQRLRRQQLWQIRRRALGGLSFRLRWTGVPQTAPIPHHLTSKYRGIHELMELMNKAILLNIVRYTRKDAITIFRYYGWPG